MKTAVVTGATGGIGEKICEVLADDGFNIVMVARDIGRLDKLSESLQGKSKVKVISCDVSDYAALYDALSSVQEVDVLINCAGVLGPVGAFADNDMELWESAFRINFFGTVNTCKILLGRLNMSKKGKIINFAGGGSAYPRKYHTSYGSAKAAVVRFTETLAVEYPDLDINSIAPGAHKTKMWDEETFDTPPKEWSDMSYLQKFIRFLCSDKSDGITGKFIHFKDDWESWSSGSIKDDYYTLRRIDDFLLEKLRKD